MGISPGYLPKEEEDQNILWSETGKGGVMSLSIKEQSEEVEFSLQSEFHFRCDEGLPCFTQCCRDVNIYLTPYDVLRLRRALKMGSTEFLDKYTHRFLAKRTNIPVVQLLMNPKTLSCPFVEDRGCRVYNDRPWACRMYPLDPLTPNGSSYRLVAGAQHCLGLREPQRWTVEKWLQAQGVAPYERMENIYQETLPKEFRGGKSLDPSIGKILFLAYDLDQFLNMINGKSFRKLYQIDEATLEKVKEDDEALLRLACYYIRNQISQLIEII